MKHSTYFDSAATTPLHPEVLSEMNAVAELWGNAGSKHAAGFAAHKKMEEYMVRMATVLRVPRDQIVVTHGGTDANLKVLWAARKRFGLERLWCSAVEHSSTLDEVLEQNRFDPHDFGTITSPAQLIALMHANNETGEMFDLVGLRAQFPDALILSDWVQGVGKVPFAVGEVDFATLSAHKFYGPKGVGLIYMKDPEHWPELSKDTHTKSLMQVAGMAKALELLDGELPQKLQRWTEQIRTFITAKIPDHKFHTPDNAVPGILNVAFKGVRGSELMTVLSKEEGICISTGSACTSDIMSATTVMKFLEPEETWRYPVRIGLHQFLTDEDVEHFCEGLLHYVLELRGNG